MPSVLLFYPTLMTNIAIADDHVLFRKLLRQFIEEKLQMPVLFEAGNGKELLSLLSSREEQKMPDIIIMDIGMPVMNGQEATSAVKAKYPSIKILAISSMVHEHTLRDMLQRGAHGFVSKNAAPDVLDEAIKTVITGKLYIQEQMLPERQVKYALHEPKPFLSHKQLTFLQLCVSDKSYKEIASDMQVSPNTVESYREDLFKKLNIKTRQGLVIYAFMTGLIAL
jgi:DNA-binding NarL/FixJ family response regulator